jgi:hypothetical protein
MHWYCLFIDDQPAADWHRHRCHALRDAMTAGAAAAAPGRTKRLVWQHSARIHVCDNARDRDRWAGMVDQPPLQAAPESAGQPSHG